MSGTPISIAGQILFPDGSIDTLLASELQLLLAVLQVYRDGKSATLLVGRHGATLLPEEEREHVLARLFDRRSDTPTGGGQ